MDIHKGTLHVFGLFERRQAITCWPVFISAILCALGTMNVQVLK